MIVATLDPSLGVSSEILQNVGLGAHRDFDETLDRIDGLMQERRNSIALAIDYNGVASFLHKPTDMWHWNMYTYVK